MHLVGLEFIEAVGNDGHRISSVEVVQYIERIGQQVFLFGKLVEKSGREGEGKRVVVEACFAKYFMEALHPYLVCADEVLVMQLPEFGIHPHEDTVEVVEAGDAAVSELEVVKQSA